MQSWNFFRHRHTHTYTHTHTHKHTHTERERDRHTHTHTHTQRERDRHTHTHTHTHTERERDRHTHTHTHTERDTHTQRETHTHTHTHTHRWMSDPEMWKCDLCVCVIVFRVNESVLFTWAVRQSSKAFTAQSHAVYSVDPPCLFFSIAGHAGKRDLNVMTLRTHGTGVLTPLTFCGGAFDDCGSPHDTRDTHSNPYICFRHNSVRLRITYSKKQCIWALLTVPDVPGLKSFNTGPVFMAFSLFIKVTF